MEPLDFSAVQAQLVRCQEVLDAARQEGWTDDLVAAFDEATRDLHEGAVVRKALQLPKVTAAPEETPEATRANLHGTPPPLNRLSTVF